MARKYDELSVSPGSFERKLAALQQNYIFVNPAETSLYLKHFPFLIELLQKTRQMISKYFAEAELSLERTEEPESSSHCRMILLIRPPENAVDVFATYKKLQNEWSPRYSTKVKGHFCIQANHPAMTAQRESAWDILFSYAGTYEGPEDWSAEHDHYLYGTPKRGSFLNDE